MNKPKLKINELFSGIGAQIEGLKNINVFDNKVICTSDIDKDAMLSYAIINCGLTEKYINNRLQEDNIPFDKIADWLTQKNIGYDYKKNKPYNWYKLTKTDKSRYKLIKYYLACTLSKNMGDISLIQELPYADLWTYSFPCQDISLAGKQAGIKEGTRSGLLLEVERLLTNAISNNNAPKYLLLENVKNLVGGKHRADFDIWLNKLDELGYNNYWQVLNAKDYGIPQNRERVFIVSIRKDVDKGYEFPKPYDSGLRLKDLLEDKVEDKYYIDNDRTSILLNNLKEQDLLNGERFGADSTINDTKKREISNCIIARYDAGIVNQKQSGIVVAEPMIVASRGRNPSNPSDRTTGSPTEQRLEPNSQGIANTLTTVQKDNLVLEKIVCEQRTDEGLRFFKGGVVGTLRTIDSCGDKRVLEPNELKLHTNLSGGKWDKIHESARRVYDEEGIAPTISTCGGGNIEPKVQTNYKIRKLTPKECWRLMGFADEDYNKVESMGVSNSQLYKQAGNSIVVNCIELLMEHLYKVQYDKDYVCRDENFTIPHN